MDFDAEALAADGIRELRPYQPGKPAEELAREQGLTNIVKLASNENPLGPSPKAIAAAEACIQRTAFYPDPRGHDLKTALSDYFDVSIDQITLGNGSDNLLAMIVQAFLNPGQNAIMSQYGFSTFAIVTRAMRGVIRQAPAKDYAHDLEAIANAIDENTRLIFLANANNPTGTWFTQDELITFLNKVPQHVLVVLDEAYYGFVEDSRYPNSPPIINDYPNLLIVRTFSKLYGLAGLRVAYSITHPAVADLLNRVRLPFNVSLPAQAAAIAALSDKEHLEATLRCNREGLQQVAEGLEKLKLPYIPSSANFIAADFQRDALPLYQALLAEGVITRPLVPYNMPHHLRISIGTKEQNAQCISALKKILT